MADEVKTREHATSPPPADLPRELGAVLVRVLCADDLTERPERHFLEDVGEVCISRGPFTKATVEEKSLRVHLRDPYVSTRQTVLARDGIAWSVRDEASRNGTLIDGRRLRSGETVVLQGRELIEVGHTFYLFRASVFGCASPRECSDPATLNPEWELQLARADKLARTGHEILIEGESGAGKELLARRLHDTSGRTGPFVAVNCAALAENLLDDELFGHVKGAFSGAHADRQGLIRAADQGTLLLDEVGDMAQPLQAKLLRVLEDHRVRPLGSEKELAVDVRVIAATHRDLRRLVAEGKFRQDLLARLGLLPVRVPPVRERREDLGIFIRAIVASLPDGLSRVRFELEALRQLLLHSWPLNVRELRRAVLSAVEVAQGSPASKVVVGLHHLPPLLQPAPSAGETAFPARQALPGFAARKPLSTQDEELRRQVHDLLVRHQGNVAAVARELGKPRSHVQRLMARLGLERAGPDRAG